MRRRRLPRPGTLRGIASPPEFSAREARAIRAALLRHYDAHARVLPWRGERDPYRIWVSEVMLQQTRVETVRGRYDTFLRAFPTLARLARAPLSRVLKAWEGLGYYGRARNLHRAAREVAAHGTGVLPRTSMALRDLPGFGPYTAAAVASIAFRERAAVVDGNVARVLARLLDEGRDAGRGPVRARLAAAAQDLLDPARPGDWNQAVMDLGATVCVPRAPRCTECPLTRRCRGRIAGHAASLPRHARKPAIPHFDVAAGIVWRGDRVLIARRPAEGLLGGLWEFPGGKRRPGESLEAACRREVREETGLDVEVVAPFLSVKHAYSHFRITLHAFHCLSSRGRPRPHGCEEPRFEPVSRLDAYAFPRANRRLLEALLSAVPPGGRARGRVRGR